mgnify:CR=1 FL=1
MENPIDIEKKAANLILKRGVKVQVLAPLFLRLFGKKTMTITVRAPKSLTLVRIAEKYLSMRIENTNDLTLPESFQLLKFHSFKMTEIIAICLLDSTLKMWRMKILARFLSRKLTQEEINYLFHLIIVYGGVEDFINTIRLMEAVRITKPMNLSPEQRMS